MHDQVAGPAHVADQVVMQDGRDLLPGQQIPVVPVQVVTDEHLTRPVQFIEGGEDGAVAAAAGATRAKLDEPLAEMEKIKTEAATIEVDACTGKARDLLVSSMTATIDAYRQFKGETGDPSDAVKAKNKEGANLLAESSAQISLCK